MIYFYISYKIKHRELDLVLSGARTTLLHHIQWLFYFSAATTCFRRCKSFTLKANSLRFCSVLHFHSFWTARTVAGPCLETSWSLLFKLQQLFNAITRNLLPTGLGMHVFPSERWLPRGYWAVCRPVGLCGTLSSAIIFPATASNQSGNAHLSPHDRWLLGGLQASGSGTLFTWAPWLSHIQNGRHLKVTWLLGAWLQNLDTLAACLSKAHVWEPLRVFLSPGLILN